MSLTLSPILRHKNLLMINMESFKLLLFAFLTLSTVRAETKVSNSKDKCTRGGTCTNDALFTFPASDVCECYEICFFHYACLIFVFDENECNLYQECDLNPDKPGSVVGEFECNPAQCSDDPCVLQEVLYISDDSEESQASSLCDCQNQVLMEGILYFTFDEATNTCYKEDAFIGKVEHCETCTSGYYTCTASGC